MKARVLLERGDKKTVVSALDWPGWTRSAKGADETLARLIEYGPRYQRSMGESAADLKLPKSAAELDVVLETGGDASVDFGLPHAIIDLDREQISDGELTRLIVLLEGAWDGFERAAAKARGKTLSSGPRGGGRSVAQIIGHVHGADRSYVALIGATSPPDDAERSVVRNAFIEALHARLRGELLGHGPRGGQRWPARYAIRRSAWHALDHAWEIEDRVTP